MMASNWPSSSLRSLVSRLPLRDMISMSGRRALIWQERRRLEVPRVAPPGMSPREVYLLDMKASRGSSRFVMALM